MDLFDTAAQLRAARTCTTPQDPHSTCVESLDQIRIERGVPLAGGTRSGFSAGYQLLRGVVAHRFEQREALCAISGLAGQNQ